MVKAYIRLKDLTDVQRFYKQAMSCSYDLVIEKGMARVNAKSLMGLLSLHKENFGLIAKCNSKSDFMNKFGEFIAE